MTWTAPPPSRAPQDWTPPPAPPLEWRDGIAVSPWLRSVLHPRRGGIATAIRPLAGLDEAWAGLRRGVWVEDEAIRGRGNGSPVWQLVTSPESMSRAVGLRLLDPAPRIGTAGEDRALVEACRSRFEYLSGPAHDWLADFLVASHGLVEGCRRLLGGMHVEMPYSGVGAFARLRQLLVLADEPTYAQARDALLEVRDRLAAEHTGDTRADVFWATTFLLPVGPLSGEAERRAHAAALRYTGAFGNVAVHASGLAAGDLATLERFLAANRRVRWEFFSASGGRIYLASVLDVAGAEAAGPVLAAMKPSYPFEDHAHHNGAWCSLLAHIDDDAARAALRRERESGHPWATLGPLTDPGAFEPGVDPSIVIAVPDGVPCDYVPPPAAHPVWLEPAVPVEPVLRWRDEERQAAERLDAREGDVQWDGVPISRCDTAQVTAWLEHREHWALPTTPRMLALAPLWTHERLMALGFEQHHYWVRFVLPLLLVRHGTGHVAPLLAAFADPRSVEPALQAAQPVGHAALAAPVTQAFAGKKLRRLARTWLLRHPEHAAAGAVALWSAKPKDPAVARVLRYLDTQGRRALLLAQAGARAGELAALLDKDPGVASKLPAYVTGSPLPPLVAGDGDVASGEQVRLLLARLAVCDADEVHPGVLAAREAWTPASRAAFALELFERWLAAGAPAADGWCMQAVGLIGDDAGARRIAALAKQWPGQGASARAQAALDALRHRGTDAALIELNLLAEKSRFPVFKGVARQHIEAIADLRGLTSDELADRLVPTLGLDDAGDTVDTDAGTFRIVFDHQLLPVVRDSAGRVHAELPKPARGEDRQRHKLAKDRVAALRKEARASASLHVSRLERAMCTGRRIPAAIFLDRFATHPWMSHLARRLVWGVFDGAELMSAVRVAEDGTLATVADDLATLPPAATLGVLHPLEFPGGALAAWGEVFADYALLQPFEQLGRPFHAIAPAERSAAAIGRFEGAKVTYAVLRGLERHGWTRWYDATVQMAKPIGGGAYAILTTDPGWHASDTVDSAPPQTVGDLVLAHAGDRTFGDLPPVVFSELIHDLRLLS